MIVPSLCLLCLIVDSRRLAIRLVLQKAEQLIQSGESAAFMCVGVFDGRAPDCFPILLDPPQPQQIGSVRI